MSTEKYRTVILDDDPLFLKMLSEQLNACSYRDSLDIDTAASVDELSSIMQAGPVDILFADINLDGDMDAGISAVSKLIAPHSDTQVIYVTGYLEKAVDVYETKHVYFLTKPIDAAKLESALAKAVSALQSRGHGSIVVNVNRRPTTIALSHIRYMESNLRKILIHTDSEPEPLATYERISEFEKQLPAQFVRCHGSFLVNLAYVVKASPTACILSDGTQLPVSRTHSADLRIAFSHYLRESEA